MLWFTHPSDAELMELLEGGTGRARPHVAGCAHCQARLAHAEEGLRLALASDVPEPSPLYWEAFRRQVGRRIMAEDAPLLRWRLGALLAAAAATLALVSLVPPAPRPAGSVPLPAWSAFPEEDPAFSVAASVMAQGGEATECSVSECLDSLSDEEQASLLDSLRQQLRRQS